MLTREHAIAELDFRARKVVPDRLRTRTHQHYVEYANEMLHVYHEATGRRRRDIHRDIEAIFAKDLFYHPRRVQSFCKLLDDKATYDQDSKRNSAKLRSEVFLAAGRKHPLSRLAEDLFDQPEQKVKAEIAAGYQKTWPDIENQLFDDVLSFNRLKSFNAADYPDAPALLARYNVAQFQVALFDATQMRIHATMHLKLILRFAKLADLMHTINLNEDGSFLVALDGPASVLDETRRYGTSMAKFLPGLLSCANWSMEADIRHGLQGTFTLRLCPNDGLRAPVPTPDEFDSDLERKFAGKWGAEPRDGWTLERESEPLIRGQHLFFPDFVFRHETGKRVLAEIIGYWTPEYLAKKRSTLERFQDERLLLIVRESAAAQFSDLPFPIITYKSAIKLEPVMNVLAAMNTP